MAAHPLSFLSTHGKRPEARGQRILPIQILLLLISPAFARHRLDCHALTLGFDQSTGQWQSLQITGHPDNLLGSDGKQDLELIVQGTEWPRKEFWTSSPPAAQFHTDHTLITITKDTQDWHLEETYRVYPDSNRIQRRATVQWRGKTAIEVQGAIFRIPGITMAHADDAYWSLPGNYPVQERRIPDGRPGHTTQERGWTWADTGVAYTHTEKAKTSILSAFRIEKDSCQVEVEEGDDFVSILHRFHILARLEPGNSIELGQQWLQVLGGATADLRRAAGDFVEFVNQGPPQDRPEWLTGAVLMELHPWGRLEAWDAHDRGNRFPNIERQLPYLKLLGVDAIWHLPLSEKPPWVYHLPAFRHIDPQLGTPDQFRSFIRMAHELDMKVLMDLVTYGVSPDSAEIPAFPKEVWCLDDDGQRQQAWGDTVLCADCSHPEWQQHITDLGAYWVKNFGADGFRLDCGGQGQKPNWRPTQGIRANGAMLAGGISQNTSLRSGIRRINPDAILLPEAGSTCHFPGADLLFDYPLHMVCRDITRQPDTALWVAQTRQWLAAQQLTHSPRQQASLVRFLENHDVVAAQDFFGAGPSQALAALCIFIPGVFLIHQEQEIGFAPDLREWLWLRKNLTAIQRGHVDYLCITAQDSLVLPILRYREEEGALIAINFSWKTSLGSLFLPNPITRKWPICQDAFTGEYLHPEEGIEIPPYRPRILTLRETPRSTQKTAKRMAPANGKKLVKNWIDAEHDPETTRQRIQFNRAVGWFVKTSEGLLWDHFVQRHKNTKGGETYVDATPPLARCWRPKENGSWDALESPSLGILSEEGRAAEVIIQDPEQIQLARIRDPTSIGDEVEIIIDSKAGANPIKLQEHENADQFLASLRPTCMVPSADHVQVDPLWVHIANDHYRASLSRRHGGTLFDLRKQGSPASLIDPSEIYSDWGIFKAGVHAATEWETNPRLSVKKNDSNTTVTFQGNLRRPSWNGVQTGAVIKPELHYTLSYQVDDSPNLEISLTIASATDRPGTKAFLAYRIPFKGINKWTVAGTKEQAEGSPGENINERVFQCKDLKQDLAELEMHITSRETNITIHSIQGSPQNPFLLDSGPSKLQLFAALLDGKEMDLGKNAPQSFSMCIEIR
jgi:alpha amylase-like protein